MKLLTFLAFFVTATLLSAQTKQIAHRSHGGSPETFSLSASEDNFGRFEPEPPVIDSAVIDSMFNKATQQLQQLPKTPAPGVDSVQLQQDPDSLTPTISNQKQPSGTGTAAIEAHQSAHSYARAERLAGLGIGIALPIAALALFAIRRRERSADDARNLKEETAS